LWSSGVDERAEDLNIQARGAGRSRLPLHPQCEPGVDRRLDGLDDAVERRAADFETVGDALNRLTMLAVDHNLAFAVNLRQDGARLHKNGMAKPGLRRMAVLQRLGQLFRQIAVVKAAVRRVHCQKAAVDSKNRKFARTAPQAQGLHGAFFVALAVETANDDA